MFDASGNPIHFTLERAAAAAEPLTAAELKSAIRVDVTTEDDLIDVYIKAARQAVESATGRALTNTTCTMYLDSAPANRGAILLPVAPVSSITSIKSYDVDSTENTVATTVYRLDASSLPARVVLKDGQSWPSGLRPENGLLVTFVAGYGATAASVTDTGLTQAVRLLAGHYFTNREAVLVGESVAEVPMAYEALIAPHRVPWL